MSSLASAVCRIGILVLCAPLCIAARAIPATCNIPQFETQLLDRINQVRAAGRQCGTAFYGPAAPIAWNERLTAAAAVHAADMARNDYFAHLGSDRRHFSQRISAAGYSWWRAAENIAANQISVQQAMDDWLKSPGHCANIMSATYTETGVACVLSDTATYRAYWVMELARPR